MYIPIDIPVEMVELIKFVLPEITFIVTTVLVSILAMILIGYSIYRIRKDKKERKNVFISFSKDEWDTYRSTLNKGIVKIITDDFHIIKKDLDPRRKLCGTWAGDDFYHYYISDLGSHFKLVIEDRITGGYDSYVLCCSANIKDHNVFTAVGDEESYTIVYDKDEDKIIFAGCDEGLVRIEKLKSNTPTEKPQMEESEISEI